MKNKFKISMLFASAIVMLMMESFVCAVPKMPDGPAPVVSNVVIPVKPVPVVPTPVAPKSVAPTPVAPKSVAPKSVVAKVAPVTPAVPKISVPVAPEPMPKGPVSVVPVTPVPLKSVAPVAKVTASASPVPVAVKPFVQPVPLVSQVVGVIAVKNSSKYSASWTGWKTKYKTVDGKTHYKLHRLKVAHELQSSGKRKVAKTLQGYTVHNLPEQSFVEGVSHLMINDQPVSVEYKDSAWMPGVTDAIYVTSANGITWMLDKKAMDKSYKQINAGIKKSKKTKSSDDDSISKVTDDTKAATVAVVLKDKKNQKKFKNIGRKGVSSKASQAFDHAVDTKAA